ncbi:MAG: hypothetical protein RL139_522 [Gemmatimonadota bacterium]|jgi:Tol biopolymer transport system component
MRLSGRLLPLLALAVMPLGTPLRAQGGYFGQNHVQFRTFAWQVLKTEHFDIHYYPELETVARYAGQMAERSYARLSRLVGHEFRERKPILIFGSRTEFAQNNVTGDLGEGTGGVTDALRQRNMFFFAGDLGEAEHVLTHEMAHVFQYDIFARGRAGEGMQQLAQVNPPLWFIEGMAEYLSIGPQHPYTDAIMRDAALNGHLPTIEEMTEQPNAYFPYRYGEALWAYVGRRWGDEIVGEILQAAPSLGVDRAFKRYLGMDLEDLGEEWKEDVQQRYLPQVATLERPRRSAAPLLNERRTGGVIPVYVAPALSPDGKRVAYISTGSLLRAEVFLDLYLADATTGKRLARLTKSTLDPEFEELRYLYSQGAFSPDGRLFAFTAQRRGRDVLYVYDLRKKTVVRRLDTDLQAMMGPSWSPDGRKLVFSGASGGLSDLYMIDADGRNLTRLTDDHYGDLMPQWSPDGQRIAFVSERGPQTDLATLALGPWRISVLELGTGTITTLPGQAGKNLNPQWAPDGQSLAFVSDRTGIAQIFLYDLATQEHYQLTRFVGGVLSVTENSPVMSWAREADKLAFTYQDDGEFTIWSIVNPRELKKEPYRALAVVATVARPDTVRPGAGAVAIARALADSIAQARALSADPRRRAVYRGTEGLRPARVLPSTERAGVSVAALLDSATLALPDPATFTTATYKGKLRAEYVARPQVGYAQDNFGRGVYGGTAIVLADMVGNERLALAGGVNGRLSEAQLFAEYTNLGGRFQYQLGLQQQPYFFLAGAQQTGGGGQYLQTQVLARYIARNVYANGIYPFNRFTRLEYGANFQNVDRSLMYISQGIDLNLGLASGFYLDSIVGAGSLNYVAPFVAYVSDNALFSGTGGIYGHRYRASVEKLAGNVAWTTYGLDLRRYDPIVFSYLTLASRFAVNVSAGPDEMEFPKFIGRPDFVRGYDRELYTSECSVSASDPNQCAATQLLGSRVAYANVELRFPLVRRFVLGVLPISLPPVDGLFFYDFGMAWSQGQTISATRPANYDFLTQRYPLRSYGFGIRMNLFNIALIRWDYSIPRDGSLTKGYWFWTLGQSF